MDWFWKIALAMALLFAWRQKSITDQLWANSKNQIEQHKAKCKEECALVVLREKNEIEITPPLPDKTIHSNIIHMHVASLR